MTSVREFLAGQQRALFVTRLVRTYAVTMLAISLIALGVALWGLCRGEIFQPSLEQVLLLAITIVPISLLLTWLTQPSLEEIARELDLRYETQDRLLVSLALERTSSRGQMEGLAYAESLNYLADASRFCPRRPLFPREFLWLIVPVTVFGLLSWTAGILERVRLAERPDGPAEAAAEALRSMAEEIRRAWDKENVELAKLAPEIEAVAQQVAQAINASKADQQRATLGALSQVEESLRQSAVALDRARVGEPLSQTEREALAAALKSVNGGRDAAGALNRSNPAEAARALEKFLDRADQAVMRDVGEALSQELQQRGGASGTDPAEEAMKLIRRACDHVRTGHADATKRSLEQSERASERIQEMRARIAAMKRDVRGGRKPDSRSLDLFAFEAEGGAREGFVSQGQLSEKDTAKSSSGTQGGGSTEKLLGKQVDAPPEGMTSSVSGVDGDGETLQTLVATAGREARAQRAYKNIYQAALPAVRDAVLREEIPEGLRMTVRRYFEAIRPSE